MAPGIGIIGAGIFVKTQYLSRLTEIPDLLLLKCIWSRSKESAREAVEVARNVFGDVECKYGDAGLDEIINDTSIVAVIVALAGQIQVQTLEETIRRLQVENAEIRAQSQRDMQIEIQRQVENQVLEHMRQRELEAEAREQARER